MKLPDQSEATARHPYRLTKSDRLHHRTLVEALFREGASIYGHPLRLVYRVVDRETLEGSFRNGVPEGASGLQMMVTVPKKKRRRAVDRVLMRRRIREAYRLNRKPLTELMALKPDIAALDIAFIYLHGENAEYADIEKRMKGLIAKLTSRLCPDTEQQ